MVTCHRLALLIKEFFGSLIIVKKSISVILFCSGTHLFLGWWDRSLVYILVKMDHLWRVNICVVSLSVLYRMSPGHLQHIRNILCHTCKIVLHRSSNPLHAISSQFTTTRTYARTHTRTQTRTQAQRHAQRERERHAHTLSGLCFTIGDQ